MLGWVWIEYIVGIYEVIYINDYVFFVSEVELFFCIEEFYFGVFKCLYEFMNM